MSIAAPVASRRSGWVTAVVLTVMTTVVAGVEWPTGLLVLIILVALFAGAIVGYLPVFLGVLVVRSSLDAFTDVGLHLGAMRLNVPAAAALFLVLFAAMHRVHGLILGAARPLTSLERAFALWLVFLTLYVFVGARHYGDWGVGLREWTRLASIGCVLYLSTTFAAQGAGRSILVAMFLSLVAPLAVATWQWTTGSAPLLAGVPRVTGTFFHPITLSVYLIFFIALTVWRMRKESTWLLWTTLLLLEGAALVSAYSLTAIVLIAVVAGYLTLRLPGRLRLAALVGGAALVTVFAVSRTGAGRLAELKATGSIERVIATNRSTNSLTWRIWHWWTLWQASRETRWLGAGLGTSQPYVSPIRYEPHNDVLRMFVETGPLGTVLYLGLFLLLLRVFDARTGEGVTEFGSVRPYAKAVGVGLFVVNFFDNIVTATALQYYVWCLAGLLIGAEQSAKSASSERASSFADGGATALRDPGARAQPL